ncbi:hypothetical protein KSF78_0006760 [Schistosoma japonicum]|nr:hypothetical protein KSF78_0006760 [Schistosoma japonicum]
MIIFFRITMLIIKLYWKTARLHIVFRIPIIMIC